MIEGSFIESLCFYLGVDYEYYATFVNHWFTVRGLTRRLDISVPPTPRLYISVPLWDKSTLYRMDIDTDCLSSSLDDSDIHFDGVETPDSFSGLDVDAGDIPSKRTESRSMPDIVRTLQRTKASGVFDRQLSFPRDDVDPGFCSGGSPCACADGGRGDATAERLEELQRQLERLQEAVAGLVTKECAPPPPPGPPPPPPSARVPLPIPSMARTLPPAPSGMAAVLRDLSSATLRHVPPPSPRPIAPHQSMIAAALRQRFLHVRMLNQSTSSAPDDDDEEEGLGSPLDDSNLGRSLLRKVDRTQLPAAVCRDFGGAPDDGDDGS